VPDKPALVPVKAIKASAFNVSNGQPREPKQGDTKSSDSDLGAWISLGQAGDRVLLGILKNMGKSGAS
jgi:hypothetical protein